MHSVYNEYDRKAIFSEEVIFVVSIVHTQYGGPSLLRSGSPLSECIHAAKLWIFLFVFFCVAIAPFAGHVQWPMIHFGDSCDPEPNLHTNSAVNYLSTNM